MRYRAAFTLIELLVVIAIIAILAAILFPVFSQAKQAAKKSACLNNIKQIGISSGLYGPDFDDRLPDRRDLKSQLGYKPWSTWPTSDPRNGWAAIVFEPYLKSKDVWNCPGVTGNSLKDVAQVLQQTAVGETRYWMWRFDRIDPITPLDNFWGKTPEQALEDLRQANNAQAGIPEGLADVELLVDPYFPRTIPSIPTELKGKSGHTGGRNRLFLDFHAKYLRDPRTEG